MDPLRLISTISILLAIAGVGGAFRACGSIAARGAVRGAASAGSSAARIPPHVLRQLARSSRAPIVIPGATGRGAAENALRAGGAGHAAGAVGDDAASLGARGLGKSRPSGLVKDGAGNLDSVADVVTGRDDDDRRPKPPTPGRRR